MNKSIIDIIVRKMTGHLSDSDQFKLKDWIDADPDNLKVLHWLEMFWLRGNDDLEFSKQSGYRKLQAKILKAPAKSRSLRSRRRFFGTWSKVAAVLAIAIGLTWTMINLKVAVVEKKQQVAYTIKKNEKGRKTTFKMPDGTIVKLNSDSKIKYLESFDQGERIVELEGEAFFQVAKDAKRPFIVKTEKIQTVVLGTSFNVRAYDEEKDVKVALVEGRVKVVHSEPHALDVTLALDPSKMLTFDKNSSRFTKTKFDQEYELAWVNKTLYFRNEPLLDIIPILERWYGVSFSGSIEMAEKLKFTGKFENKSLSQVMNVLSKNQSYFSYAIDGKRIEIHDKNQQI